MSALCSPMCTIFIRDYLYFYGKYFVLRITTSMRIKRFIPENLYIIFPRILEILKSRTKNLEQRSAKNSVRIHGELICLCRAIDHRGFTVEERKMLSTRSRVFYSRSSFALFPRDNENGRVIYILYTDAEKGGGRKTRSLCF